MTNNYLVYFSPSKRHIVLTLSHSMAALARCRGLQIIGLTEQTTPMFDYSNIFNTLHSRRYGFVVEVQFHVALPAGIATCMVESIAAAAGHLVDSRCIV